MTINLSLSLNSRLSQQEISALAAFANITPILPKTYWLCSALLLSYVIFTGYLALSRPLSFIEILISPSINATETTIALTTLRGMSVFLLSALWLAGHVLKKISITKYTVLLALVVTTAFSFYDMYTLFSIGLFTSTIFNSMHILSRPIIFILLLYMFLSLRIYAQAVLLSSRWFDFIIITNNRSKIIKG